MEAYKDCNWAELADRLLKAEKRIEEYEEYLVKCDRVLGCDGCGRVIIRDSEIHDNCHCSDDGDICCPDCIDENICECDICEEILNCGSCGEMMNRFQDDLGDWHTNSELVNGKINPWEDSKHIQVWCPHCVGL
jgi:hypothetical protein